MDFSQFQDVISKINGVISCKINENNNCINEVHILANCTRSPKQIVRDVESSIYASFDHKIDRKMISIAQIQAEDSNYSKRIKFSGISMSVLENSLECCVKLLYDEEIYAQVLTGIKTVSNRKKIVADATIKVIEKIIGKPDMFEIQDVLLFSRNEVNFVTVIVNIVCNDAEETMVGSVLIGSDTNEAIVKATLSAINRRIEIIKE